VTNERASVSLDACHVRDLDDGARQNVAGLMTITKPSSRPAFTVKKGRALQDVLARRREWIV
jgi:hypothetical protein